MSTRDDERTRYQRELWLLYLGGIMATRCREDPIVMLGRIDPAEAPRDLASVVDALVTLSSNKDQTDKHAAAADIRQWCTDRGLETGNGVGVMEAVAGKLQADKLRRICSEAAARIGYAGRLLDVDRLKEVLQVTLREIEELS